MDGRRISASPRPCSVRRVVAKKRPRGGGVDGFVNSVRKLQRREICSKRDRAFSMSDAQERFRNIRLQAPDRGTGLGSTLSLGSAYICLPQEEYDTHDPKGHCATILSFLRKRSKIIEIVAAHDIVFALAQSGICAAFSRETNQRICFLNVSPDEVIRSLFYNKNNDSLITVSVYASDNFSSLKCRTTRIECVTSRIFFNNLLVQYIKRGKPDAGFALFESESLKWPGFVEFDDVNGKVLTYSAQDSVYKVFDLKNYTMLYSISDKNVQEIKISPGIMLLIFTKNTSHVPLKILSIEDGTVLKSFNHLIHRNKKVDFIEQFNEKLLVKQENENLQILDVRNSELTEVSKTDFMTPSAFIFLYENQLFLTFRNRTVAVWNFRGELVTSFEDHLLWHPDCNTNNIYITSDQDLIISYCKADSDDPLSEGTAGSINVSNILTGKCLAKIRADNCSTLEDDCGCSNNSGSTSKKRVRASRMRSTPAEALEDITALFYDEERNEIYTGNRHGLVHVWSN
ncbi:A disintegrin and metalloproteinase with thrombospondin motifs 4 [Bienertia sinuspersici]